MCCMFICITYSEQLLNMLESFSMLLNEIILQIKKANRGHSAKLPHALILLILETVSSYQNNSGAQSDIESDTCLCFTVLNQLVSLLESWITCKDVMGELFGGKEITFYSSWKGKEELMVHNFTPIIVILMHMICVSVVGRNSEA